MLLRRQSRIVAATARGAAALSMAVALLGCGPERVVEYADTWPEANALFLGDSRWVGGDGALTVPLGGDRILWLFGDSFIARGPTRTRDGSAFIRNSVAVQTGRDPTRSFIEFYWSHSLEGPRSFLPEQGDSWFWPGHGVRFDGGGLLLFYGRLQESAEDLGYASDSWTAVMVDNPDDEPSAWAPRELTIPRHFGIDVGNSVLPWGDFLYVYSKRGHDHDVYLVRWRTSDAERGDLTQPSWWCGEAAGWVDDAGIDAQGVEPAILIEGAAPELSVHHDAATGRLLEFETTGFGATTLGVRWADAPEGPWSEVEEFLRPPESFLDKAFVYAGKAHPELTGADVVLTYVPSAFPEDGIDEPLYYYPRFARATLERR